MLRKPPLPRSLGALAETPEEFFIVCDHCRHFRRLDAKWLGMKYGWQLTIDDVLGRCRCKRCRQRQARLSRLTPRDESAAMHR